MWIKIISYIKDIKRKFKFNRDRKHLIFAYKKAIKDNEIEIKYVPDWVIKELIK